MRCECIVVILAFVTEQVTELDEIVRLADESMEVVMSGFMAQVADHGPERLAELPAEALAMTFVGFGEVECHDALVVAGRRVAST